MLFFALMPSVALLLLLLPAFALVAMKGGGGDARGEESSLHGGCGDETKSGSWGWHCRIRRWIRETVPHSEVEKRERRDTSHTRKGVTPSFGEKAGDFWYEKGATASFGERKGATASFGERERGCPYEKEATSSYFLGILRFPFPRDIPDFHFLGILRIAIS
ncbi:hypothetical protein DFH27DRAFT_643690 [Peziza echinospora]|nr:hypothetical protein DFH27DRAFT_643690 [Peziza echinospora]